jgi:crotonobetainyl-CoA:carnitine CoA-transferase CaiB-like acyl-CoA transferase
MPGPLESIKVLSFAKALAGPYASMLLCDLGAELFKIEGPQSGDMPRQNGPFIQGISSYFLSVNRGQKSITLDLRDDRVKKMIFELVKQVDIWVENFRPGAMSRLGLSYEVISRINPKIIYSSVSGFGQKGPYKLGPAFDMIAQGMGGTVIITGEPGRPPVRVGYSIGDIGAALFSALAILAALHEQEKSGKRQWIDVAMVDSQVALCEKVCARYFATGEIPKPQRSRHPLMTPFQIFPTKDGYIILITALEEDWRKFCKTVGREDLGCDPRFQSHSDRIKNYVTFELILNELMSTRTNADWISLLDPAGIMCGPVNGYRSSRQRSPHNGKGNGCRGRSSSGGKVEGGGNIHEIFTHPLQNRKSLPRCRPAFDGGFQRHVGNFY